MTAAPQNPLRDLLVGVAGQVVKGAAQTMRAHVRQGAREAGVGVREQLGTFAASEAGRQLGAELQQLDEASAGGLSKGLEALGQILGPMLAPKNTPKK